MNCSTPGLPVHHQLPESTQTHVYWVGDAIQPSHPLSPSSSSAINFPSISVFSNESALRIRWPKYWSFSFNISPSNEHPGLISFRMDWLDLLAGTHKRIKPCFHLSDGVIYSDQRWGPAMWILLGGQWNRYRPAMRTLSDGQSSMMFTALWLIFRVS